jgi:FkbM family methyltransferase
MDHLPDQRKLLLHVVEKDIWVSGMIARGQPYEPFETQWIHYLVRPGDVALDIGAHIGYYTVLLSELVGPHGRVFAFEPDPTNFAILQQNLVLNRCANVTAYNLALSNQNNHVSLFLSGDNAGDHRIWQPDEPRPSVSVQAIVLDDFWAEATWKVDFVKMDIQGAEGVALHGMRQLLSRQRKMALVSEFWPFGLKRSGWSPGQFLKQLHDWNCNLFIIDEGNRLLRQVTGEQLAALNPDQDVFMNLLALRHG